jgi:Icc-related predicted phosphoesterase
MIIAATADVYSPRFFTEFVRAVDALRVQPDLFLMAGDMVYRGDISEYEKVVNALFGKIKCPIIACFGNNEFQDLREQLKGRYKEIKFLDDEAWVLEIGTETVGIVGTSGSLDTPTPWQKANMPNIEKIYQGRVNLVDRLLQRMNTKIKIVLMHYAPTYKSLEGENPRFFSTMGSQIYEPVIQNRKPSLVVHGHSLHGNKLTWLDTVPIFKVGFPLNKEIVIIDTEKDLKPGIAKFV